mgnify:FL=1|jgi:hypothetical protein
MKKIDWKLGVIGVLIGLSVWMYMNPTIQEVEKIKEIEVLQTVIDSIYVEKLVEKKVYVPKYITETKTDTVTIEVIKEIEKPVEVVKTVYVDKPYEVIVPRYELPESKWYAGFAYQWDMENYFSGANVQVLHKFKNDKMFSIDVGFRNDLIDLENNLGKLRPYVGGTIYFRLDKPKDNF